MSKSRAIPAFPFLMLGAASLLAGLAAGLGRLDWALPLAAGPHLHGPLMVCGFFGTVIGLERAVALGRAWTFGAPGATALGGIALLAGVETAGALLLTLGSLVFLAMAVLVARRQPEPFTRLLALGAASWVAGNLLWLAGTDIPRVVPLWAAFLVLTIAGERLELSRFLPPWRWRNPSLLPPLALVATGAATGWWSAFGAGLILLVAWCLRNDIVRRTIRQAGLTRYVAICLLTGYAWLAVAGGLMLGLDGGFDAYRYDAALHALFVGFVFAMVFGHAPVILPAVLRIKLPFHPGFYAPLALLHLSLALRIAGDLAEADPVRRWGGLLNAAAILAFIATTAVTAVRARAANAAAAKQAGPAPGEGRP